MTLIFKDAEIQEELSNMYDLLVSKTDIIRQELACYRENFCDACDKFIADGFTSDQDWISANNNHHQKFIEYDTHCHLVDIVNDFKDLYGQFPEYLDMYATLENLMIHLANEEKYEAAAIIKLWVDKIKTAIVEFR